MSGRPVSSGLFPPCETQTAMGGLMEHCESKTRGSCRQPATWKQTVQAGKRESGRFLYYSYWCDEHAEIIVYKRRLDRLTPPMMVRLVGEPS